MTQQSLRKLTSTYASVMTHGHSTATNVAEKENLNTQSTCNASSSSPLSYFRPQSLLVKATAPRLMHLPQRSMVQDSIEESNNDDEHEADGDYAPPADDSMRDHGNDDDDDADEEEDEVSPVRGRTRRMSEKQAQLLEEQRQAEDRKHEKALKAAKAAKKKAGVIEPDTRGPIQDDSFTSRTPINTRPMATKNLTQRNRRVPAPAKFPSPDWREDTRRDSHYTAANDLDDDTRRVRANPEEPRHTFRGGREVKTEMMNQQENNEKIERKWKGP
ncbi:hypothetical protein B0H14DRAFT_3751775 [Mycena olivaceomarginata]|nr:hypothetical protein B0H14DRAFT_3751775 [Mycena olivaceomarginata]